MRHSSKVRFHQISIKNLLYQISFTFGKSAMTLPCKNTLIEIADIFERCLDIQSVVYNLVLYKIYPCEDTVFSPGIRSAVYMYSLCVYMH